MEESQSTSLLKLLFVLAFLGCLVGVGSYAGLQKRATEAKEVKQEQEVHGVNQATPLQVKVTQKQYQAPQSAPRTAQEIDVQKVLNIAARIQAGPGYNCQGWAQLYRNHGLALGGTNAHVMALLGKAIEEGCI